MLTIENSVNSAGGEKVVSSVGGNLSLLVLYFYLINYFHMNEIDRIKLINDLVEGQETLTYTRNVLKYLSIRNGKIEYTNQDLDELIEYFEKNEYFEQCENLRKLKNNLI